MDLSALIFVALAVAWAVYLVPKALKHHEEDAVSRTVEGFSDRLRVVARREAVSASEAALVRPGRRVTAPETAEEAPPATPTPAPQPARSADLPAAERRRRRQQQAAARRAAERRRRVFNLLLLANVVVGAMAIGTVVSPLWVAGPLALMVAWLVACRVMVRRERAARVEAADRSRARKRRRTLADEVIEAEDAAEDAARDAVPDDNTDEIPMVRAALLDEAGTDAEVAPDQPAAVDPAGWAPVPVTLPTYVAKEQAGRTVRTIDLDSTGVWSSGRNDADSQLAREADEQRARSEGEGDAGHRATGS
ncbi:MAG TPA: hypothetical protein VNS81_08510 [Nocardioides sp.]|nr:hypothetical protein [Nocardioides sp.]